jgi:hypothetical protein
VCSSDLHCKKVDDAGAKLEARAESIYHAVWGKNADERTLATFTQNSGHPRVDISLEFRLFYFDCRSKHQKKPTSVGFF